MIKPNQTFLGYAFGISHFITFDGKEYTFPGRGYFALLQAGELEIQIRLEQPQRTSCKVEYNSTVQYYAQ